MVPPDEGPPGPPPGGGGGPPGPPGPPGPLVEVQLVVVVFGQSPFENPPPTELDDKQYPASLQLPVFHYELTRV